MKLTVEQAMEYIRGNIQGAEEFYNNHGGTGNPKNYLMSSCRIRWEDDSYDELCIYYNIDGNLIVVNNYLSHEAWTYDSVDELQDTLLRYMDGENAYGTID